MSLANRLKELRRALSWTQQDLSNSSGLTRSYISRLEMGDIALPSSEKLRALAQALGTSTEDLLQAAGYIESRSGATDLPEIKTYLRRKYDMQDSRALHAIETIVNCLQSPAASERETEQRPGNGAGQSPRRRNPRGEGSRTSGRAAGGQDTPARQRRPRAPKQ